MNNLVIKPVGVNNPKKIIPNIIGFIIIPKYKPSCIHNLFNGNRKDALNIVIEKKTKVKSKKVFDKRYIFLLRKNKKIIKKTNVKKKPNFLFVGSFILEILIFYSYKEEIIVYIILALVNILKYSLSYFNLDLRLTIEFYLTNKI